MKLSQLLRSLFVTILLAVLLVNDRSVNGQWYFFQPYYYQAVNSQNPLTAQGNAYTATAAIANTPFTCEVGYWQASSGPRGGVHYTFEGHSTGTSDGQGNWITVVYKTAGGSWTVGGGNTFPPTPGAITNVAYIWGGVWANSVIFYFQ